MKFTSIDNLSDMVRALQQVSAEVGSTRESLQTGGGMQTGEMISRAYLYAEHDQGPLRGAQVRDLAAQIADELHGVELALHSIAKITQNAARLVSEAAARNGVRAAAAAKLRG